LILQLQLGLKSFDLLNLATKCPRIIIINYEDFIPITAYSQEELKIKIFIVVYNLLEITFQMNLRFLAHAAMGTCSTATCPASFNSSADTWVGIKFITITVN